MRFKEFFLLVFEFRWWIFFAVVAAILIFYGYHSVITDTSVQVWVSKSVVQLNIGDLLIIICIAYFLLRK